MTMRSFSAAASGLRCLLLAAAASATPEEICKKVVAKESSIKYHFCVRILETDPASATADERGAAAIAGNLGSQKARTTLTKIHALLSSTSTPALISPLKECKELYDGAAEKLTEAAEAAKAGNDFDANTFFSFGIDAAGDCGDAIAEKKLRSPLEEDNSDLSEISAIGCALTHNGFP